jgi:hypothetical protein
MVSNGSGTMTSSNAVLTVHVPLVFSVTVADNHFAIGGSGGTGGGNYYILAATNAALPLSNWTRLATNQFQAGGIFAFTNVITPDTPQQFYRLQLP